MSPRKSDTPLAAQQPIGTSGGWRDFIISNVPLPILLAAMFPLGYLVERSGWIDSYYIRMITLIGYSVILAVSLQLINGFSGQSSHGHAGFMAVGAYMAAYPAISHSQLSPTAEPYSNPAGLALFFVALAVVVGLVSVVVFGLFAACRQSRKIHPTLPAVLMLL